MSNGPEEKILGLIECAYSDFSNNTTGMLEWVVRDWMNSRFRLLADLECQAVHLALSCAAYYQSPQGTLPDDPQQLAKLSGISEKQWRSLTSRELDPLWLWTLIRVEGERRFAPTSLLEAIHA